MTNLSIFDFETKPVRVVIVEDSPHWVAGDLAACLAYDHTPHMLRMLDDDQKGVHLVDTLGGPQSLSIVTEGGMWTCVIRSKRPEAKRFLRWLTDVVLPALRQTGTYTLPGHEPPEQFAERATNADDLDPARLTAAVAVVREARRLFGPRAARHVWRAVGLPDPDAFALAAPAHAFPDGLASALLEWVQGKDRLTYADIGHGIGIGAPDQAVRHRIADILTARGWTWRNTKFGHAQRWTWRAPVSSTLAGETVQ